MSPLAKLYLFIFLLTLGIGTVSPLIPLFARSLGGNYVQIGLLGTAFGAAFSIFSLPLGLLSDRFGRKVSLLVGSFIAVSGAASYLLASTVYQLFGVRFVEGLGLATLWPSVEALATELAGVKNVGTTMGWMSALNNAGFAVGSLLGGTVADWRGLGAPFVIYLVLALGALSVTLSLPSRDVLSSRTTPISGQGLGGHPALKNRQALIGYFAGAFFILDLAIVLTFLPVYGLSLGLSISATGLLLSCGFWSKLITRSGKSRSPQSRPERRMRA